MAKGFHFSGCRISSLIFSDVVLLTWSGDGQLTLEWEAVGMRISNFKTDRQTGDVWSRTATYNI